MPLSKSKNKKIDHSFYYIETRKIIKSLKKQKINSIYPNKSFSQCTVKKIPKQKSFQKKTPSSSVINSSRNAIN